MRAWYIFPEGMTAKKAARAYMEAAGEAFTITRWLHLKLVIEENPEIGTTLEIARKLQHKYGGEVYERLDGKKQ